MSYINYLKKINDLLNSEQKKTGIYLLFVIFSSMIFEVLTLGFLFQFLKNISLTGSSPFEEVISNLFYKYGINLNEVEITLVLFFTVFVIFVVKNFLLILVAYKEGKFIFYLRAYFSENLFSSYQKKPYSYFFNINSSKIINNITVETNHLTIALLSLSKIILESVTLFGILIFLLILNVKTAIIIILLVLFFVIAIFYFNKNKLAQLGKDRITILNKRLKVVQEIFGNIKLTKIKEKKNDTLFNDFISNNLANAKNSFETSIRNALPRPLFEIYIILIFSIFFIYFLINDLSLIKFLPSVGVYLAAGYRVMPSLVKIIASIQLFSYNIQSIDPIKLDFNKNIKKDTSENKRNIIFENIKFEKKISFKGVSYSYEKDQNKTILKNINLDIEKNSHLGIIGETGSGKSTFVDLLLGLIHPSKGSILVDNIKITENIDGWQKLIGYVPQDIFLNDSSIKKNVAYGVEESEINENQIISSLKLADIYDFVAKNPQGLNTELGEKGIKLSGGQKQRLAIARALYFNPQVIIFDEATSSLDYSTESNIIRSLDKVKKDKTLITITHRKNTLLNCDKIYEIKDKELIEKK